MKFHRYISTLFIFFTLIVILSVGVVHAQAQVNVRTGSHSEYSRLVFDWPSATTHQASKSGGMLTLSFNAPAAIDVSAINQADLKNIGDVRITSSAGDNLKVTIAIKPESKVRDFKIGNRVVVDIYNAAGAVAENTSMAKPQNTLAPRQEEPSTPAPSEDTLETAQDSAQESAQEIGERDVEIENLSGLNPHVITLTSTRSVGMAAFEREGFFWMVFDNPQLRTNPVIAGPQKDKLPKIEKIEIQNGVAYRMPIIDGYKFYGEGGGLLWRVVMTPNPRRSNPVKPVIEKANPDDINGGTLVWPFKSPEKIIKVTDPLVGDEIQVVTVKGSEDFAGPRRSYVELETFSSPIGLAFAARSDDIKTQKTMNGLEVTTPTGLALSSQKDNALAVLRDDIEKEKNFFDEAEKTERLSLIFDFNSWEMGGLQALEKNRQILMRGIGAKQGADRVEDIITLAKLNLANDRGPEALGLLKVAAQELPGIDENPEYIALRGAANVLADHYSDGLQDLSDPSLAEYTERDYWRAKALAGLEDWRQADQTMPTDFDPLQKYPLPIQKPLILSMAEISLRAAKPDQAEELLLILEPEFPTMTLSEQSAWKYLNGEMERQFGNPKDAIENWTPLIKGKDDYYRAKAGLSLTRLQLERKKITPAKAIDRLEGLRYAWRGDELEALINLRLGEVYIENGDYLKGLSVLRNAVSLSPDAPITAEVTEFMTQTFENIFTDGTLDRMSPIDAISVYDEFKELTPLGEKGDIFVQNLAERLVDIDLLGRASTLLEDQLDNRLKGEKAVRVGIRLAAIQLIDGKPDRALETLQKTQDILSTSAITGKDTLQREVNILRARALSKVNRASEALNLLKRLSPGEDVSRLRADIAWNAGQWDQAANAFSELITQENISLTRPADDYATNLIINRAIALNLAGNRTALSELRTRYQDLIAQTDKAKIFDLVTRPRQLGMLNSKDSVSSLISEVDLFGEFLENYKSSN